MPINIPTDLPARHALEEEKIFVMTQDRAQHQDIRPLRIALVNLMPAKISTETQILRLLSNTPLQVDIDLIRTISYQPKHSDAGHLDRFYTSLEAIRHRRYDGMIITGAPVETLPFEQVDYWQELQEIMDFSLSRVYSTLHLCWGAQAGLYHHLGLTKEPLPAKLSGIFTHQRRDTNAPLLRGFDDQFPLPHSRYTDVPRSQIEENPYLTILADSPRAGAAITSAASGRQLFVTGHPEYDAETLALEYRRDQERGISPSIPENYFPQDNPENPPTAPWRAHAHLLFTNWLNYCVYQETPFHLEELPPLTYTPQEEGENR